MTTSTILTSAAALDAIGRFVSSVGVPAAIAFFILWQIGPKLDSIGLAQQTTNTELSTMLAVCAVPRTNQGVLFDNNR